MLRNYNSQAIATELRREDDNVNSTRSLDKGTLEAADAGPHEKQVFRLWSELALTDSASFFEVWGIEGVPDDLPWPNRSLLLANLGSHVGMPHETFPG